MTGVCVRDQRGGFKYRDRHKEGGQVMGPETGEIQLQIKGYQGSVEATKAKNGQRRILL